MEQYIPKSAVIAEIEKLKAKFDNYLCMAACDAIEESIDTLEVKEVDFEKELDRIWFDNKLGDYFDNDAIDFARIRTLCRHFFELGLQARKGGES